MTILCSIISIYTIVLIGRAILSWFPISPDSAIAPVVGFLYSITEPILAPVRRLIPPIGGFDISFIVVFLGIQIISGQVLGCRGVI